MIHCKSQPAPRSTASSILSASWRKYWCGFPVHLILLLPISSSPLNGSTIPAPMLKATALTVNPLSARRASIPPQTPCHPASVRPDGCLSSQTEQLHTVLLSPSGRRSIIPCGKNLLAAGKQGPGLLRPRRCIYIPNQGFLPRILSLTHSPAI